ncbi:MAG: hypothetical protein RR224_04500, partial [Clostridia bacterium]
CAEADAQGIVVNDGFYHLPWLPAFPGCVDITLTAFDGSATIAQLDAAVIELEYQNVLLEMGVSTNAV